jgi:hypothetical protein
MKVNKVTGPPNQETSDFVVDDDDKMYYFKAPERGRLEFERVTKIVDEKTYREVNEKLPDKVKNKLKQYFKDNHNEDITVKD